MRFVLLGEDCRTCGETVGRSENFCPRCGAETPWMPRLPVIAAVTAATLVGGLAATKRLPEWMTGLF